MAEKQTVSGKADREELTHLSPKARYPALMPEAKTSP